MKFIIDHDMHIHSFLSNCSKDENQLKDAILDYGIKNKLSTICITDHFWDERVPGASRWYSTQDFAHISEIKPLPQNENCRFLFGCETDMDKNFVIGVSKERLDEFDFIIVPTTHLHMARFTREENDTSVEGRINLFIKRFEAFLNADLPFEKVGLAHITCSLIYHEDDRYLDVLNGISDDTFARLFRGAAERGCGIELNIGTDILEKHAQTVLRPYRIAKAQGCKFYLGSDAHSGGELQNAHERFEKTVELLELQESDKFNIKELYR